MNNHKLAIIVPYRDRRDHLDVFIPHMEKFLENKGIDYKLFIIEQADDKPFNYGKLCNSAFHLLKDEYDYFCFHDVDMLPINDSCDYSYKTYPIHLATKVIAHNEKLPYLQYFGGVNIFSKEDFEKVNGYSNEYWGWGIADIDLLQRCEENDLDLDRINVYPRIDSYYGFDKIKEVDSSKREKITYFKFDGESYISVLPNKDVKTLPSDSFTLSCWVKINEETQTEQYIVSWPGFNSGISFQRDNTIRFNFWGNAGGYYFNYEKIELGEWNHIVCNVSYEDMKVRLWINNLEAEQKTDATAQIQLPLRDYSNDLLFIGCGSQNKNFYKGDLANVYFFDYSLTQTEITNLYLNGLQYNKKNQTKFEPTLRYEFDNFYNQILIDKSKNHNHAKIFCKNGNEYLSYVKEDIIEKTSQISVPARLNGQYQSLEHYDDMDIWKRFYSFDPDITENMEIYFEDIKTKKYSTKKIGLNNLKFKLVKQETYDKKTEWLKIIL